MSVRALSLLAVPAVLATSVSSSSAAINLGDLDTFQDGSSAFWTGGVGPTVIDDGGPLGAGDRFLQQTSDGSGSGGKLTMYNRERWVGNYSGAGVTRLEMDLKNFTSQTLSIRIAFKVTSDISSPGFVSSAFSLPADNQWHHAVYNLVPANFTAIGSPGTFASVLAGNNVEFRILHSVNPSLTGNNISNGRLGYDNIHALPAPGSAAVLALAAPLAFRRRRG
jgi:hypothetical protein